MIARLPMTIDGDKVDDGKVDGKVDGDKVDGDTMKPTKQIHISVLTWHFGKPLHPEC